MNTINQAPSLTAHDQTCQMLHELGISVHRHGYQQLRIGIPHFAHDSTQALAKELYPYISDQLGFTGGCAVERSIRGVISDAWKQRDPDVWDRYFPKYQNHPSNKEFIATLAERLE